MEEGFRVPENLSRLPFSTILIPVDGNFEHGLSRVLDRVLVGVEGC